MTCSCINMPSYFCTHIIRASRVMKICNSADGALTWLESTYCESIVVGEDLGF